MKTFFLWLFCNHYSAVFPQTILLFTFNNIYSRQCNADDDTVHFIRVTYKTQVLEW